MSGKKNPDSLVDRINDQVGRQTGMTVEDRDCVALYSKNAVEAAMRAGVFLHGISPAVTLATILQCAAVNLGHEFGFAPTAEFLRAYADFMEGKGDEARLAAILSRLSAINAAKGTGGLQ
jgi:hypothetical protein